MSPESHVQQSTLLARNAGWIWNVHACNSWDGACLHRKDCCVVWIVMFVVWELCGVAGTRQVSLAVHRVRYCSVRLEMMLCLSCCVYERILEFWVLSKCVYTLHNASFKQIPLIKYQFLSILLPDLTINLVLNIWRCLQNKVFAQHKYKAELLLDGSGRRPSVKLEHVL